jgi:tetratricopeptide (TPR) repeat protein
MKEQPMSALIRGGFIALLVLGGPYTTASAKDFSAANDAQVLESLPARVNAGTTPQAAAQAAQRWIEMARQNADPRYLGRAQAVLARWWDQGDAPPALAVLQATVQQSRHEFDAARRTLTRTLQRDPTQAQGWLTLATLERVAGKYEAAAAACQQLERHGAALYAQACLLETRSLVGEFDAARNGFDALLRTVSDAQTKAWLLSLKAESEERAGRSEEALTAFQSSLALADDGYTALALADLQLRLSRPADALQALAKQANSDAVVLRRARAYQLQNDARWRSLAAELRERFAALDQRGDDPRLHARERALALLWLDADPRGAWPVARSNLELQKEPLDWWLALESAKALPQKDDLTAVQAALNRVGLKDARLGSAGVK